MTKFLSGDAPPVPDIGNSLVGVAVAQRDIQYAGGVVSVQRDIPYTHSGVVRIPEVQR